MRSFLKKAKPETGKRPARPMPSSTRPTALVCAFNKSIATEFDEKLRAGRIVRDWSPQQQAIHAWFEAGAGNLVVVARAGTGKSTTILGALDHIPGKPQVEVKTLHSLGYGFQRAAEPRSKLDDRGEVEWDRIDEAVNAASARELSRDERKLLRKLVSRAKGTLVEISADAVRAVLESMDEAAAAQNGSADLLVDLCHRVLRLSLEPDYDHRISFDDMLFIPTHNKTVTPRYDWVIVDEAQDMNPIQLVLARAACKPDGHLVFVGDDMQAIYGFRGADSGCLKRLKHETDADELTLTVTYRCPRTVVAVARAIVSDFTAHESAPEGVVRSLGFEKLVESVAPGDAVLSRINAPLVHICLDLLTRNVRASIKGKDIGEGLLAIVKKVRGTTIDETLTKLGIWHQERIARIVASDKGKKRGGEEVSEGAAKKIEELNDRVECLRAIAESVDSVPALDRKLDDLFTDRPDARYVVTCSSVHKAKGLEWPRVFMLADTFNMRRRGPDGEPLPPNPEENNIRYVAITRAQQELVQVHGRRVLCTISVA